MANKYSLINFYEILDGAKDGLHFDMYSFAFNSFADFIYNKNCEVIVVNDMEANTPDLIAFLKYGDERLFWIICLANKIIDPFEELPIGTQIAIPSLNDVKDYIMKHRFNSSKSNKTNNNRIVSLN